jgi:hypothetical protein
VQRAAVLIPRISMLSLALGAGCTSTVAERVPSRWTATALNGGDDPGDAVVYIRRALTPIRWPTATEACALGGGPSWPTRESGVFDVALRDNYLLAIELVNRRSGPATFTREGRAGDFHVRSVEVDLRRDVPGGARLAGTAEFTIYPGGDIPEGTDQPGVNSTVLEVFSDEMVRSLRERVCAVDRSGVTAACPTPRTRSNSFQVIASLRVTGVFSRPVAPPVVLPVFLFPITICCGCLVSFPLEADVDDAVHPGPDCLAPLPSDAPQLCLPGQDDEFDCRRCVGTTPEFCQPRGFQSVVPIDGGVAQRIACAEDR